MVKINARNSYIEELLNHYPVLEQCLPDIIKAIGILKNSFFSGGELMVCGNGGSAADSEHIVGELLKSFVKRRPLAEPVANKIKELYPEESSFLLKNLQGALPAISLSSQLAFFTAYCNDVNPDFAFAQQVLAYGKQGDVLLGSSTSGNSKNVINALKIARSLGLSSIGLSGGSGGEMADYCDCLITVPAEKTYRIQELHLPIYHTICLILEEEFFR